jgi:hypothetical protein
MRDAMFVICGNCRTFVDCIDSIYTNLISQLFNKEVRIFIYFYLKLTDPGPKGQDGWNFAYNDCEYDNILCKIQQFSASHPELNIEHKILHSNEISDNELIAQVKDRRLYNGFYSEDNKLLRGLHCHYNLERCGKYILENEQKNQCRFGCIIYVRPDLYFVSPCNKIESYNRHKVTLGRGPNHYNNDHLAIIPRRHLDSFFFDRMNLYRHNTVDHFDTAETVYWHTITYEEKPVGEYYIKRS